MLTRIHNLMPRRSALRCVWCRDLLSEREIDCRGCGATYHGECADESGRCGVRGCTSRLSAFVPGGRTCPESWPVRIVERIDADRLRFRVPTWVSATLLAGLIGLLIGALFVGRPEFGSMLAMVAICTAIQVAL